MKKFAAVIAICGLLLAANLATAQAPLEGKYPPGGGLFTISNPTAAPVQTSGLNFDSPGGNLIPAPGGAAGTPEPYQFMLANTPTNVAYAVLPPLSVDYSPGEEIELAAGYQGGDDLVATLGLLGDPMPVAFQVEELPEPGTGLLAAFGALGILGFRRRR